MPELPEVETIRRGLKKLIIEQRIRKIEVLCEKSFIGVPPEGIIVGVRRFGKALILDLDSQKSLMIHLRMTGQLIYDGKKRYAAGHPSDNFTAKLPNGQTRVIFYLDEGNLFFNDQRKFGFVKVMDTREVEKDAFILKLAPEPWRMDENLFFEKLQRHRNSSIKSIILDQTVICGLGNIYADESLFMSKIHPLTKCGMISRKEAGKLLESAKEVMDKSIASGGSTMKDYVKADGSRGDYLDKFAQVFRREGQPCRVCGTTIIKIRVAGRGTHICPHCQVLEESNIGGRKYKNSREEEHD